MCNREYDMGYDRGYTDGKSVGFNRLDDRLGERYNEGYEDGMADGNDEGHDVGWHEGFGEAEDIRRENVAVMATHNGLMTDLDEQRETIAELRCDLTDRVDECNRHVLTRYELDDQITGLIEEVDDSEVEWCRLNDTVLDRNHQITGLIEEVDELRLKNEHLWELRAERELAQHTATAAADAVISILREKADDLQDSVDLALRAIEAGAGIEAALRKLLELEKEKTRAQDVTLKNIQGIVDRMGPPVPTWHKSEYPPFSWYWGFK